MSQIPSAFRRTVVLLDKAESKSFQALLVNDRKARLRLEVQMQCVHTAQS